MTKSDELIENKIFLIEDDKADVKYLTEILSDEPHFACSLETATRLKDALKQLETTECDVILLDLCLPDSLGIETFNRIHTCLPQTPIIILTGTEDDTLALAAMRQGAQDYLVKRQIEGPLLVRAIRYALERHKLQKELESIRQQQERERETLLLQRMSGSPSASITAQTFGIKLLHDNHPEVFSGLTASYSELLDRALERSSYRINNNASTTVRNFAERLGTHKLGPREVVEIHVAALKEKTNDINPKKAEAYVEEGRVLLLELMGSLASYYRNYCLYFSEDQGVHKIETTNG